MADADVAFMGRALELARQSEAKGEVPVGAVLVMEGSIIGEGANRPVASHDPTAHAEVIALREAAAAVGNYRLTGSTLYVTLEPCPMCVGAMVHARVGRVVFGARDPKTGALGGAIDLSGSPAFKHRLAVEGGCLGDEAGTLLRSFFQSRR